MGRAPSLLLVMRVTIVSVSVLLVIVSVTLPSCVGTAGKFSSPNEPPTGGAGGAGATTLSGCLTLMTTLEPALCSAPFDVKWAGIIAWNSSFETGLMKSSVPALAELAMLVALTALTVLTALVELAKNSLLDPNGDNFDFRSESRPTWFALREL